MELLDVQRHWDGLGELDPLWAICSDPAKRGNGWEIDEFFATGRESVEKVLAFASRLGYPKRHGLVLDFGCGVGRLTQALCESFERAVGVDIAPSMVKQARELNRVGERCSLRRQRRRAPARLDGQAFDLIVSSIVLQHIEPRYALGYVQEFVRLLAPDGLAVFDLTAEQGNTSPLPARGVLGGPRP